MEPRVASAVGQRSTLSRGYDHKIVRNHTENAFRLKPWVPTLVELCCSENEGLDMLAPVRLLIAQVIVALACSLTPTSAHAQDLQKPTETPILSVSGSIKWTNAPGAALFDLPLLRSLPAHSIVTNTAWTEGKQTFEGVRFLDLLGAIGAKGMRVRAVALNDYAAEIPLDDPAVPQALIAYYHNGLPMSVRSKGPLWIVFPYDTLPDLQSSLNLYSVWQLSKLIVE